MHQINHSLFINCGGEEIDIDGNHHYSDNETSEFYVKRGISVSEAPLYEKARLSLASSKYYGLCLRKGKYNVALHFAEILFGNDEDYSSSMKRIFDGERRLTNFNIKEMANGTNKVAIVENLTAVGELPNHTVAVKRFFTLSNEGIIKLKSEFYTLESLRHENLVRLFDVYVGKGLYLMVYEYMENRSLADALFGIPFLLITTISYR
ncbi:hypothetical protein FNV43_RR07929 [Rhamnella rubrinervis]|uniref:non-specific serine/threonine protein kinase n=1 Tax=Rhamnella rubrinervis TaxID=2594499 RepID=A0A8K0HGT8_9ROSA|nr:hypothetical protein FNV43_RR07929 [Rhamnella rubrinervis]